MYIFSDHDKCYEENESRYKRMSKEGVLFLWMFMLRLENLKNKVTFPSTYQMKCVPGRENSSAKRGTSLRCVVWER